MVSKEKKQIFWTLKVLCFTGTLNFKLSFLIFVLDMPKKREYVSQL